MRMEKMFSAVDSTGGGKIEENKIENPKIKEGVDFVFEQNPELSAIGTKEQYSKYLETIFPDSKFRDIVYHGTNAKEKFDNFDLSKKRTGTRNLGPGVYFTTNVSTQHKYANFGEGHTVSSVINTKDPFITSTHYNDAFGAYLSLDNESFTKYVNNDSILDYEELDNDKLAPLNKYLIKYTGELVNKLPTRQEYFNPKIHQILIPSTEQIHILGSSDDLKKFGEFVEG